MTDDQAREIYRRIFTAYPDYLLWLKDKVPDAAATMATWRQMLSTIPVEVGDKIACELAAGTRKMPAAYDRGQFGAVMRSWCQRIVDDANRSRRNEAIRNESTRRGPAITQDVGLFTAYQKSIKAAERFRVGEIDEAENRRLVQQAIMEMPHNRHRNAS